MLYVNLILGSRDRAPLATAVQLLTKLGEARTQQQAELISVRFTQCVRQVSTVAMLAFRCTYCLTPVQVKRRWKLQGCGRRLLIGCGSRVRL